MKRRTADDLTLENTIRKFTLAAGEIGLTTHDLITLLDSGMSMDQLVDYVAAKQAGRAIEN